MRYLTFALIMLISFPCFLIGDDEVKYGTYGIGVSGGMGINATSFNDLTNYINAGFVVDPVDRVSEFTSTVEFFLSADGLIRSNFSLGADYSYSLNSYTIRGYSGTTDFQYSVHTPLLSGSYVVFGPQYHLKFGGAAGLSFMRFEQKLPFDTKSELYKGSGFAGMLNAIGHTPFGGNLYGYIGLTFRFGIIGDIRNDAGEPLAFPERSINMDYISFGVRFGLTYYL
jgi:hypothetical protein